MRRRPRVRRRGNLLFFSGWNDLVTAENPVSTITISIQNDVGLTFLDDVRLDLVHAHTVPEPSTASSSLRSIRLHPSASRHTFPSREH